MNIEKYFRVELVLLCDKQSDTWGEVEEDDEDTPEKDINCSDLF